MKTFIARQPIFDHQQNVYAYELLFRDGFANAFEYPDQDEASSKVMTDSFLLLDIEKLTGGKIAFVNVTKEVLVQEYVSLFPKELLAVEILETVEIVPDVITACQRLKEAGYLLVLDDFVYSEEFDPLLDIIDIIKVDVLSSNKDEQKLIIREFSPRGIHILAEKVETHTAFQEALDMGYTYFQGYFFSKPAIITSKVIPGYKLHHLHLIKEIQQFDLDFGKIENIIKRDLSLSYKLLRYINSAFFGLQVKVRSLRHALTLLGKTEIQKWTSLVSVASMGNDKPEELVTQSIIRAKFCEVIAPLVRLAHRTDDLFLIGMFSLIDAIVDRPISDLLKDIPVNDDVKATLLGEPNPLRDVFECIVAYEQGNWEKLSEQTAKLRIDETQIPALYQIAVDWGNQSLQGGYLTE